MHLTRGVVCRLSLLALLLFGWLSVDVVVARQATLSGSSTEALVNLESLIPGIDLDLRYATTDNFTGQVVYPVERAFLVEPAARALALVQADLKKEGYGLRVYDAYRPLAVQREFWKIMPDPKYVADPKTGSRHNRGASVDVTLIDARGNECEMPTLFDDFSEKAGAFAPSESVQARLNRHRLQKAMTRHGFRILKSEWWHFDFGEWKEHPILDLGLDELAAQAMTAPGGLAMREWRISDASLQAFLKECDDKGIGQLMLVVAEEASSPVAMVQFFEKKNECWVRALTSRRACIGRKGVANPGEKREGDGKSPGGIFKIGRAFGYAASTTTKMPYLALAEDDVWVDDPKAPDYNLLVKRSATKANSYETMRRKDDLYKYGFVVEYNTEPIVPGHGSAIFIHIQSGIGKPTAGCIAFGEDRLQRLFTWLDPSKNPHVAIGTFDTLFSAKR